MEGQIHVISEGNEMRMRSAGSLTLAFGVLALGTARANHFAIALKVETTKESKAAKSETLAPGLKAKVREVFAAKAGQKITVRWTLTNTSATTAHNVLVHFFVVKEEQAGQAEVPKLTKDVVAESAVTLDFAPKDKTTGELTFRIERSGAYLVRLETISAGVAGTDDHEHFAALDLTVP
jgi:hypothetical protein